MAIFPLAIKRFTEKRNLLDDVDASHINDIQSEITAIETTLGDNPQNDNSGGKWATVKDRLSMIQNHKQVEYFHFFTQTAGTFASDPVTPPRVTFPAPSGAYDSHGLYSNSYIKLERNGYYYLNGRVFFANNSLRGKRRVELRSGDKTVIAVGEDMDYGTDPSGRWVEVSTTFLGFKDQLISLHVDFNTPDSANGKYTVGNAHLQGFWIRQYG